MNVSEQNDRTKNVRFVRFPIPETWIWTELAKVTTPTSTLDVLITVMATIGRTCVVPADIEPAIITKHVYRMSLNRNLIIPHFFEANLRGCPETKKQMQFNVRGQTRPGLNKDVVSTLPIPLAPLEEQGLVMQRIEQFSGLIESLEPSVAEAGGKSEKLRQAVLKKAFEGGLVSQNPTDEPASELLSRIHTSSAANNPMRVKKKC